ncbi:hypothetical protein CIRG_09133 [Coccidioides immitis RMSCC 2394]|uniref:Uncharacterized protein n=1 Tax=Coccidioides immitis RMSCC 2394 TaxID=404692 RepID=A0A0J6YQ63_COCIT|nr:hypothetical protein CIRG_09133 [Coccidioides immitis RMSCC 2394]
MERPAYVVTDNSTGACMHSYSTNIDISSHIKLKLQTLGRLRSAGSGCSKGPFAGCCGVDPCDIGICLDAPLDETVIYVSTDSLSSSTTIRTTTTRYTSKIELPTSPSTHPTATRTSTQTVSHDPAKTAAETSSPVPGTSSPAPEAGPSRFNIGRLIAIVVPIGVAVILLLALVWFASRRQRKRNVAQEGSPPEVSSKPPWFRGSVLASRASLFSSEKQLSHNQPLSGRAEGYQNKNEIKDLYDNNQLLSEPMALAASSETNGSRSPPAGLAPPMYSSLLNPPHENQAAVLLELLGSIPQGPPIEVDDTSCDRITDLSSSSEADKYSAVIKGVLSRSKPPTSSHTKRNKAIERNNALGGSFLHQV